MQSKECWSNRECLTIEAKVAKSDRDRINPEQEYEIQDWAKYFGVSNETVKQAVQQVGPMMKIVEKALRGK